MEIQYLSGMGVGKFSSCRMFNVRGRNDNKIGGGSGFQKKWEETGVEKIYASRRLGQQ